MNNPVFDEVQSFGRHGLWFAMLSVFVIALYSFFQLTLIGVNTILLLAMIPSIALFFFLVMFFRRMELHIRADEQALEFRFSPVQKEFQVIEWKFVEEVERVETSPIRRLAGWGVQYGPTRAYTVGGTEGVELHFSNGKKLFLGTKRAAELERVIRKFRKKSKR